MIVSIKYLCGFTILALLINYVSGIYDTREGDVARISEDDGLCPGSGCVKRGQVSGVSGSMWFGPRLGRRRRSDEKTQIENEETNAIADVLNGAPWALVSLPGGKRHAMQVFTPRLGRDSGEDYVAYNSGQGGSQDDVEQRSPPFAPRLGRRLPFIPTPRLGRELRALFEKV